MSKRKKTDLTKGAIHRHLIRMAIPMTIGIFASMAFALIDTYFLGKLGGNELAAIGFVSPVMMIIFSASIGLSAGTAAILAPAIGAHDEEAIREYTTNSIILTILMSIAFSIIGLLTIEPLFVMMGAKPEVMIHIHEYMGIWYYSTAFVLVPMIAMGAMRAAGDTKIQGYIMILAAIFNAILDPILIFGLFGFPRMEVEGAALASMITRFGSFVAVLYYLLHDYKMLEFSKRVFSRLKSSTKKIMHVGIPAAGTNIIIPISSAIIISIVAQYGSDAVAATNVAIRIETTFIIFFYALSAVIGPFIGQNLGAKNYDRIDEAIRQCMYFCFGFGAFLAAFIALFGGIISREMSDTLAISEISTAYLYIVPISYGAYGFVMTVNAFYNSVKQPIPGVWLSTIRVIFFALPLCYIAALYFDLMYIFAAISIANILSGIIAIIWVKRTLRELRSDTEKPLNEIIP
jgi:putative MATE family efflux protein